MFGPKAIYTGSIASLHGAEVEVLGRTENNRWNLLLADGSTLTNVREASFYCI